MPTNLHNPRLGARERYFARQSVYRMSNANRHTEVLTEPWLGWVPDLPPSLVGWRGCNSSSGFIPFPYAGQGLFLRHDDGYKRLDAVRQYGGASVLPASAGAGGVGAVHGYPGWLAHAVTMLSQYYDSANPRNRQRLAIIAGTEGGGANYTSDIFMVRLGPTGQWAAVRPYDGFPAPAATTIPEGDREALWDSAVFPYGIPGNRTDRANNATTVNGSITVMCNSDQAGPVDVVIINPCNASAGGGAAYDANYYDELIPLTAAAIKYPYDLRATSCESFNGRMHYFGTVETGVGPVTTYNRQRHRWTGIGTAYPDEAIVGSGYLDLAEFQGRGLRIETLGNKLALYFEDGVAFQVPTGFVADAYRPQVLSRSRGLMGTHALCAISPELHFGIFNDGWWFLDSSGRWHEAGTLILEETKGKSYERAKWKNTFYDQLDYSHKHRIVCTYDRYRKIVRIAYTANNSSANQQILNYHWPTDSCWPDVYNVSMWGLYDQQIRTALTWDGGDLDGGPYTGGYGAAYPGAAGTWDAAVGSWDSYTAQFTDEVVVQGNEGGIIFNRDPSLSTYDGTQIRCSYTTHSHSFNRDPIKGQTFASLGIEYMNVGNNNIGTFVQGAGTKGFQYQNLLSNEGSSNSIQTVTAHYRLFDTHHWMGIYTNAPVMIRSLRPTLYLYGYDDRSGQL